MSLYSLATDLFADIDKVRAAAADPITPSKKEQPRLVDDEPGDQLHLTSGVGLPQPRDRRQNDKTEQTSTLELLEGCLHDIHEIRCGARPTPTVQTKHSCEGQWCPLGDSDGTSSSSCSESLHTGRELIDQDSNAEGGTGSTVDQASDEGAEKPYCIGTDAAATDIYADFEREITEWSTSPAGMGACQRARTDKAAHLSAKYLCRKLDAMPSSAVVCHLRREVVRRIDLLATGAGPHVEGEQNKVITTRKSHRGRNNFASSGDGDHQAVGRRADDNVPPLLVSSPDASESLHGRVTPSRGPPTIRESVDAVSVDPTRQSSGNSIQAGRQFPGLKGVGPAPSCGGLYTTATKLPGGEPEAGGRIGGDLPSSCLKRVARLFPPVRLDKGGVSSPEPTGGPRARAVRFLLRADGGESLPPSAGEGIRPPGKIEIAELEAAGHGNIERFWTCTVCRETNGEGRASCTVCGKRQHGRCVAQAHLDVIAEKRDPGVVKGQPKSVNLRQQRPENRQESVRFVRSSGITSRPGRQTGVTSGGVSGRIGSVRDTTRKIGEPYDASSFAKMRRETEPAVRARLGLTGEIKSLLSAIRRNG